jgi:hypothetical protein
MRAIFSDIHSNFEALQAVLVECQPRAGDSRASYVLLNDNFVIFRRVEYDIDTTVKKIYSTDSLARHFGDRLRIGRQVE